MGAAVPSRLAALYESPQKGHLLSETAWEQGSASPRNRCEWEKRKLFKSFCLKKLNQKNM